MAQSVKADAGITVGQVFQDKYRVNAILGSGGMGVVAECTHLALNERVAIKMLRQDVLLDQDAKARFLREAQAAVKLKSEYVARVSDVGTFENGVPYMVMEYLEGHDLGELLKQRGTLPVQWAVELMLQTCEALCEAHSLSIVHRDIKPTNLFVTWRPDGSALIKVLDFGISKSAAGTDMQLTQTQSLLGTPAYMSPEQMRSARLVDMRTDIWSLGTVFYEVLEGHRPFEAESFSEMCVKVAVDAPAPMHNTPPALQHVILRCLAKAPEQRYANMGELGRDLVQFAADPHGAQMLVERMGRMLRRANMEWEGTTGVNRQAIPSSMADVGSGPVRNTPQGQWGMGTDPAGAQWSSKSDPSMRPWHGNTPVPGYQQQRGDVSQPFATPFTNDASQPFGRPLGDQSSGGFAGATVEGTPKKKSRAGLTLLLLGMITVAAVAFGVVKATTDETGSQAGQNVQQAAPAGSDSVTMPSTPTPPIAVTPPVDTTAGSGSGSGSADVATAGSAAGSGSAAPLVTATDKPVDKIKRPGGTAKTGRPGGRNTTKTTPPVDPKVDKTKPGAGSAAPPDKPVEVVKPCDPFATMHGCK